MWRIRDGTDDNKIVLQILHSRWYSLHLYVLWSSYNEKNTCISFNGHQLHDKYSTLAKNNTINSESVFVSFLLLPFKKKITLQLGFTVFLKKWKLKKTRSKYLYNLMGKPFLRNFLFLSFLYKSFVCRQLMIKKNDFPRNVFCLYLSLTTFYLSVMKAFD